MSSRLFSDLLLFISNFFSNQLSFIFGGMALSRVLFCPAFPVTGDSLGLFRSHPAACVPVFFGLDLTPTQLGPFTPLAVLSRAASVLNCIFLCMFKF